MRLYCKRSIKSLSHFNPLPLKFKMPYKLRKYQLWPITGNREIHIFQGNCILHTEYSSSIQPFVSFIVDLILWRSVIKMKQTFLYGHGSSEWSGDMNALIAAASPTTWLKNGVRESRKSGCECSQSPTPLRGLHDSKQREAPRTGMYVWKIRITAMLPLSLFTLIADLWCYWKISIVRHFTFLGAKSKE